MNLRQKLFYIPFQDISKKSNMFLTIDNIEFSHLSQPPTPLPTKRTIDLFLKVKSICEASLNQNNVSIETEAYGYFMLEDCYLTEIGLFILNRECHKITFSSPP